MQKTQHFRNHSFQVIKGSTHPEYSFATFETEEKEFREKNWDIKPNDMVLDIGCSYGAYALSATAAGATVHCFEPEKTVYHDLVNNIYVNNFQYKCFPHNTGLWSSNTSINMKSYAPHWAEQTITSDYNMMTLDQFVKNNNLLKIDWIKLDVEGAEEHVIRGGLLSINKFLPKMIIECHTFLDKNLDSNIKELLTNYDCVEIERDPCVMLICTPKSK